VDEMFWFFVDVVDAVGGGDVVGEDEILQSGQLRRLYTMFNDIA